MKITEGYMPYLGYRTYYRIVGEKTDRAPLLLLHGGPGSTHTKMEVLDPLADLSGRQLVMYDQIGCGNSYLDGHKELWKAETWINELIELRKFLELDTIHLLGQSWGGMLELLYMTGTKPQGVLSMTLSSTLPSASLWSKEQHRRIKMMSQEDQEAIQKAEESNDYTSPAYQAAEEEFMHRYCALDPGPDAPEPVRRKVKTGREAYVTAWGPNEFTPNGTLKDYDVTDKLGRIHTPTLVVSGTQDLCSPLIAKTMADGIPGARWELFDGARHTCYVDQTDKYLKMMTSWLKENDR